MRTSHTIIAVLGTLLAAGPAAAASNDLSCSWRAPAEDGSADDPTGDPGSPVQAGQRLDDGTWRALDEHFQQHHFGLWTAAELAALESTPGVALGVLLPLPEYLDSAGRLVRPDEAAAIQWPDRITPADIVLVAVGNARPAEDWVLHPVLSDADVAVPPIEGPATAPGDPGTTGFFRVHRVVGADASRWSQTSWVPRRIEVNPLEMETSLALTTEQVALGVGVPSASPQVLASGTFRVRTPTSETLAAPAVVNLSLSGPGSGLFTVEVLPAGGEPTQSSARNVRVFDKLDFLVIAPPSTLADTAFIDQLLPPGQALVLTVVAEVVSFASGDGDDLDLGLSERGFSIEAGQPVVFPAAMLLPRAVVQRSAYIEVWRPPEPPGAP